MSKIVPTEIDIISIRNIRQNKNNLAAFESIKNNNIAKNKNINIEEYKRVLCYSRGMNITEADLLEDCKTNDISAMLLALKISINASRQGTKDEQLQLDICKETFSKCGILLTTLTTTEFRPIKNGRIINYEEYKKLKIKKEDCLKSFDAKLSGKINGWVFAKFVIGSGGHQDNVFEEAYTLCEWVVKYANSLDIYIILIDTNLIDKYNSLIEKFEKYSNLIIGNHMKVQQYIIDNYAPSISDEHNR